VGELPVSDRAFVSYAREDQDFVLRLASGLKERGVPIWLDQWDIAAGADWDQTIDTGLRECTKLIVVLSDAAVSSKQVRGEIQAAFDDNKPIVPVLHKECTVPRVLRLIQNIDFTGRVNETEAMERLAHALQDQPPVPPRVAPPSTRKPDRKRLVLLAGAAAAVMLIAGGGWYAWQSSLDHSVVETKPAALPTRTKTGASTRPTAQGSLQVSVNVETAEVSIDGTKVGTARRTAPLLLSNIDVGLHRIRVDAEGYEPSEQRVNIVADQWEQVPVNLLPRNP
jgi:hypothetical protein